MSYSPRFDPARHADVCLLLEGTYPYVRGGVSSWVQQLIQGMPQLSFSIIYLGADSQSQSQMTFSLPENLVHLEIHYLLEPGASKPQPSVIQRAAEFLPKMFAGSQDECPKQARYEQNDALHEKIKQSSGCLDAGVAKGFATLMSGDDAIGARELATDEQSWNSIRKHYADAPEDLDFNHYFWTIRSIHEPLFKLSDIASTAPSADLYHSVSTGYAGFLGALIAQQRGVPYIISEHGIYTKERELDLAQVDWIPENHDPFKVGLNDNMNYLRSTWIRFFASLGKMAYSSASEVFSLYEGNRQRQIADGANPDTLTIIPNGVDVPRYATVRRSPDAPVPQVIVLIGRVVPIKDIKNFIRTMQIVHASLPEVEGWLYGPDDEDVAYTRECRDLINSLGLASVVKFKGFDRPDNIFPLVGLSVLSSVSEGQPLVVLEGFAAGIPAVTTDVGSCAELIYGVDEEDKSLGHAGSIVPIADPEALAMASIELLGSEEKWRSASCAAVARVERYYSDVDMIRRYEEAYTRHKSAPDAKRVDPDSDLSTEKVA